MAFLHLLNCLLLTFAPIFVVFNATSLHDQGARSCVGGMLGYLGSSMLKLLAYASLVPISEEWSLVSEILKESMTLIDLYIMSRVFTWKTSRATDKRSRMLGVGLGWAAADLFCSHLLILLFNAGSGEFSWDYLQRAILANWSLFQIIVVSCLVFLHSTSQGFMKIVYSVLLAVQCIAKPLAIGFGVQSGIFGLWAAVGLQAVWTLVWVVVGKILVEVAN